MRPRVPDLVAALEHDVRDAARGQLARRRQAGRAGADHEDVTESRDIRKAAYNVFRYSISARRFASVRMRDQKSWPPLPLSGPRRVEPVAIVAEPAEQLRLAELRVARIDDERLTDIARDRACVAAITSKDPRPLRRRAEQMVERRHAAVVEVRKVRPDAGQRRRRVAAALHERAFRRRADCD